MPFRSKAQQRWMFATHPQMASRWAHETDDIKSLPDKVTAKKKRTKRRQRRQTAKQAVSFTSSDALTVSPASRGPFPPERVREPHRASQADLLKAGSRLLGAAGQHAVQTDGQQNAPPSVVKTPRKGWNPWISTGMQMLAPVTDPSKGTADIFGSPILSGKLGNGPGVGFSGAGTQQNAFGTGIPKVAQSKSKVDWDLRLRKLRERRGEMPVTPKAALVEQPGVKNLLDWRAKRAEVVEEETSRELRRGAKRIMGDPGDVRFRSFNPRDDRRMPPSPLGKRADAGLGALLGALIGTIKSRKNNRLRGLGYGAGIGAGTGLGASLGGGLGALSGMGLGSGIGSALGGERGSLVGGATGALAGIVPGALLGGYGGYRASREIAEDVASGSERGEPWKRKATEDEKPEEKQSNVNLMQWWQNLPPRAREAILGGAAGLGVGGAVGLTQDKDKGRKALTYGLLGAGLGAGASAGTGVLADSIAAGKWPRSLEALRGSQPWWQYMQGKVPLNFPP